MTLTGEKLWFSYDFSVHKLLVNCTEQDVIQFICDFQPMDAVHYRRDLERADSSYKD